VQLLLGRMSVNILIYGFLGDELMVFKVKLRSFSRIGVDRTSSGSFTAKGREKKEVKE